MRHKKQQQAKTIYNKCQPVGKSAARNFTWIQLTYKIEHGIRKKYFQSYFWKVAKQWANKMLK